MKNKLIYLLSIAFFTISCEDIIQIELDSGRPQIVVDGFLNDLPQKQTIRLTYSGRYFDASQAQPVLNAVVTVVNHGADSTYTIKKQEFVFADAFQKGEYSYNFDSVHRIGKVGDYFSLSIVHEKGVFVARSKMNRVPKIDSITLGPPDTPPFNFKRGFVATLWAMDFPGRGDTYWVKTFKNGKYLDDPQYINPVFDAAFDGGSQSDGLMFIIPIRLLRINYVDENNPENAFYQSGDTIRIEIHSITREVHDFLRQAQDQLSNGGLFATPPYNLLTNISNINPASGEKPVGIFCVSAVNWAQKVVP